MQTKSFRLLGAMVVMAAVSFAPELHANGLSSIQSNDDDEPKSWYERLDFSGDLRLRYEGFQKDGAFDSGRRDRLRYRYRIGFDIELNDFIGTGVQFRSGNPANPVSDNESFSGGFDKDRISLAEAFVTVRPSRGLSITAGKFSHSSLWTVSDLHWDGDVVLEGVFERLRFGLGKDRLLEEWGISLYQLVLDESGSEEDAWLIGFQLGPTLSIGGSELAFGFGLDSFSNPQRILERTLDGRLSGNAPTNLVDDDGQLVSDFRVWNLYLNWSSRVAGRLPLDLSFFYYVNAGAADRVGSDLGITGASALASDNDRALFLRASIGSASSPGSMRGRFTYYYSEPDALFYAFLQSDSGRSSNVKGPRIEVQVGLPARTSFNFSFYRTSPVLGTDATLNRWQLDYVLLF